MHRQLQYYAAAGFDRAQPFDQAARYLHRCRLAGHIFGRRHALRRAVADQIGLKVAQRPLVVQLLGTAHTLPGELGTKQKGGGRRATGS